MEKIRKIINKENLLVLLMASLIAQPIFDLDYLAYPFLDKFGLPLPSTIFYFIGLPLLIIFTYIVKETNKKKVFLIVVLLSLIVLAYAITHHLIVKDMFDLLYLTTRYKYSITEEMRYIITLIIPLGLTYAFFRSELNQKMIERIIIWSIILIAVPLFFSNLFLFGKATYYDGPTIASFPYWFFGIYDRVHPKLLTSQFFFSEGNTTGIVLFALFPQIIRLYIRDRKWSLLALVIIQAWAMYVLATRVATYGVLLMLIITLGIWFILILFKKEKLHWKPLLALGLVTLMFYVSLPYTPAVRNIEIDNRNDQAVFDDEYILEMAKDELNPENLIPGTAQFNYFYENIFKQYYWLLTLPDVYYKWYYPYNMDPKFYVDLIFEVNFYDRKSGRQFQQIFFDYKWDKLDNTQRLFGFGYSRFMNGSILLEQDFFMQKYTLGYIGMGLLTFPWLGMLLVMIILALKNIKRVLDFDLMVFVLSFGALLGGAYLSGHVLDQFFSSTYLAFFAGVILYRLISLNKKA
jgi:hypothetical protein